MNDYPVPTNYDDIIDSREVIARIEELTGRINDGESLDDDDMAGLDDDDMAGLDDDDRAELTSLRALAAEGESFEDWPHGLTMIRDSYWTEYVMSYAEDTVDDFTSVSSRWPFDSIDWERAARDLQTNYSTIDFGDVTYWVR